MQTLADVANFEFIKGAVLQCLANDDELGTGASETPLERLNDLKESIRTIVKVSML
jgi:hypothetical protein